MRLPRTGHGSSEDPHDCHCGHQARAHEHYRRGSDCALCDCTRYRAATSRPFVVGGPRGERVRTAA